MHQLDNAGQRNDVCRHGVGYRASAWSGGLSQREVLSTEACRVISPFNTPVAAVLGRLFVAGSRCLQSRSSAVAQSAKR